MKNTLIKLLTLLFALCMALSIATACGGNASNKEGDNEHVCSFNKKDVSEQYKKSDATCESPEEYYYSCSCGQKGTETFENSSALGHDYTILKYNETAHWHECSCGDKGNTEAHKGGVATVENKAICSVCNSEYGEKLPLTHTHDYTKLKHNQIQHWYECVCGNKQGIENHKGGTATCKDKEICSVCNQSYGDFADHAYVNDLCKWCGVEFYTDGLVFTLINNDEEYSVTDYNGTETEVCIPSKYLGKPVTSIGEWAFYECYSLTIIEIGDRVTNIGDNAFCGCLSLTSIEIPNGVTSIGWGVFQNCVHLTSIEISNSVTSIGWAVFLQCGALESITFNGTIEEWNAISKDADWKFGAGATFVQCTDGRVDI